MPCPIGACDSSEMSPPTDYYRSALHSPKKRKLSYLTIMRNDLVITRSGYEKMQVFSHVNRTKYYAAIGLDMMG